MKKRILVMTSGGDAPGLNTVIHAVTRHAVKHYGFEVWGCQESFNGLLQKPYRVSQLTPEATEDLLWYPGTVLGTSNQGGPFRTDSKKVSDQIVTALKSLKIHAVINVGGDGSQAIAQRFVKRGVNIVGVPKTIDNDLGGTDQTFGYETAVETVADAVFKLQATGKSHSRIMILEVMGRDAGWIALGGGLASGADAILIPEIPFQVSALIKHFKAIQKKHAVVVVAEGAYPKGKKAIVAEAANKHHANRILGGVGEWLKYQLEGKVPFTIRSTVLGHLQRGGIPCAMDRILAARFGVHAVDLIAQENFGQLVSLQNGEMASVPLEEAIQTYHTIPAGHGWLKTARALDVCLGD